MLEQVARDSCTYTRVDARQLHTQQQVPSIQTLDNPYTCVSDTQRQRQEAEREGEGEGEGEAQACSVTSTKPPSRGGDGVPIQ